MAELQVQQVQQVGAVGASGFLWDLMFFFGDFMGSFHGISTWTWGNFMDHSHAMLMDVNGISWKTYWAFHGDFHGI